jgi:hypothetical protein
MKALFEALTVALVVFVLGMGIYWLAGVYRTNNQQADEVYSQVYGGFQWQ